MARIVIAMLVCFAAGYARCEEKKTKSDEVEILFANGSLVRLDVLQAKIDVETEYGKLSVPLKSIRRIDFGLHPPEGMDKKVETAVKQLSSGDFKERDGAVRELVAFGAYAYLAALRAAKSSEPEVAKRAADVVARIRAKVPAKELQRGEDDRIVTAKFTIVGRIVTSTIKAHTEYFGAAQLSLPQLRHLRVLAEARDANVTVDAAKYATGNDWLETNVVVDGAATLTISATGQVDLRPQAPGTMVCDPQGYNPRAAQFGGAGPGMAGPFGKKKGAGGGLLRAYSGTLLGRIGENGDVFVIGDHFEGVPEHSGKLHLRINPSQYDASSSGSYQVRISTKN